MIKINVKKLVGIIIIALTLILIFSQSFDSKVKSTEKSEAFANTISEITHTQKTDSVEALNFEAALRKYAHAIEFSILGIELALFVIFACNKINVQNIVNTLSFGLACSVCDESIQILSERGPLVKDVLIDLAGVAGGIVIVFLIYYLIKLIQTQRKTVH